MEPLRCRSKGKSGLRVLLMDPISEAMKMIRGLSAFLSKGVQASVRYAAP